MLLVQNAKCGIATNKRQLEYNLLPSLLVSRVIKVSVDALYTDAAGEISRERLLRWPSDSAGNNKSLRQLGREISDLLIIMNIKTIFDYYSPIPILSPFLFTPSLYVAIFNLQDFSFTFYKERAHHTSKVLYLRMSKLQLIAEMFFGGEAGHGVDSFF